MSATVIDGGPAGPDEAGAKYRNRILTDRAVWWDAVGAAQGVKRGFDWSTVAGQLAIELDAGLGMVEERDTLGVPSTGRGYGVWQDVANLATFDPPSASSRVDAVALAFADVAVGTGALGTQTSVVGGQIVVVPGVSGTLTARTDAQISDAVGSGGWARLLDVQIDPGDTQVNSANVTENTPAYLYKDQTMAVKSGFSGPALIRMHSGVPFFAGIITGTYPASTDTTIVAAGGIPVGMRPPSRRNVQLAGNSAAGTVRGYIDADGSIHVVTSSTAPAYVDISGCSSLYLPA